MIKHFNSSIVIVPKGETHPFIKKGSGIVAIEREDKLLAYYEGNLFNACNLSTYEECVGMANDRLSYKAPTTAFCLVDKADFIVVGEVNDGKITLYQNTSAFVAKWVDGSDIKLNSGENL
jgi:hypothetical protein